MEDRITQLAQFVAERWRPPFEEESDVPRRSAEDIAMTHSRLTLRAEDSGVPPMDTVPGLLSFVPNDGDERFIEVEKASPDQLLAAEVLAAAEYLQLSRDRDEVAALFRAAHGLRTGRLHLKEITP